MKRGRPKETEDPVRVSVRLSASDYDRVDHQAQELGVSIPRFLRQSALSALKNTPQSVTSAQ